MGPPAAHHLPHEELTHSVLGSDDFQLRVYNYNTSEKVTSFEAHPDYIRAIAVHPTQPFVLTASVRIEAKKSRGPGLTQP